MRDKVLFGNSESMKIHGARGKCIAGDGSITLIPTDPPSRYSEEVELTVKVDPEMQNYFSLKLSAADKYTTLYLYIDGKQLGYAKCSDWEALNLCYGNFLPEGYFFVTTAIPIWYTKGKTELTLSLRCGDPYDDILKVDGRIFEAYVTTEPTFDLPETKLSVTKKAPKKYTDEEISALSQKYIDAQTDFFSKALEKLRNNEKISITKYVEDMRHFIMMLYEPYCPEFDKKEIVGLILNCINNYVLEYHEKPQRLLHNAHQSDWGGYYGELGQALYLIEPLLNKDELFRYLNTPFNDKLTKYEAWEICLKANFDFASCRQSYIYNQTYYTYEGAWKAMAGLGVIESKYYIGKEKCDRILKEALGLAPWLGEHILYDETGRELDLYHCLFNHDRSAKFTDDFVNTVCTGKAVQALDENGEFIRRKPYGENYYPLTHTSLSRENGYVGNYGETVNYYPEWIYRTFCHGDIELSNLILKAALQNLCSRMYMRYSSVDGDGAPIMLMEQAIDERNPTMNPKPAYGTIVNSVQSLVFASLKEHMDSHPEIFSDGEWDEYKKYAQYSVDALYQEYLDGHLDAFLENQKANYNDFKIDRSIRTILKNAPTRLLPHTDLGVHGYDTDLTCGDFVFFDIDNLLLSLREGDTHIFLVLNHRNRAYSAFGRAHIIKNGTHHLTQFKTDGVFKFGGRYIRQQNVNMDFIFDSSGSNSFLRAPTPLSEFASTPQALCGEEQSITYQNGIGQVLRENFEVDTPYSGYPDVIWATVGGYFIACNTTRESYKNEITYTLPFKVNGEEVTLPPFSYRVIRTDERIMTPASVKVVNALSNSRGVLLSWKASEGEYYRIYRDGELLAETKETVYLDSDAESGVEYSYTVTAVNEYGESIMSVPASARAERGDGLLDIRIGDGEYGFGDGNDYKAQERRITDSLLFRADSVNGSCSISAVLKNGGLMVRENDSPDARYAYMGVENGKLTVRARSRNTMYCPDDPKISPTCEEFPIGDNTEYKLLLDKDLSSVAFFAKEENGWRLITRRIMPIPEIYYIGVTHLSEGEFENIKIEREELNEPFPIRSVSFERDDCGVTLFVRKGIDNKFLIIESSEDGKEFETETDSQISQTYKTSYKPYFRVTPISRHGVVGEPVTVEV